MRKHIFTVIATIVLCGIIVLGLCMIIARYYPFVSGIVIVVSYLLLIYLHHEYEGGSHD